MKKYNHIGVFGKLPSHGDFIMRELPSAFVNVWDEWLQYLVSCSKKELGEEWLDIYLTSPIWRFVFSSGVIDENSWSGIVLPSVDRVGRYFPFSVVSRLPVSVNPFEFVNNQSPWFDNIETLALEGLENELPVDVILNKLNCVELNLPTIYTNKKYNLNSQSLQFEMDFEEQLPVSVYSCLLNVLCVQSFKSYGIWATSGSDRIEPCLFISQGLPDINKTTALLDGEWASRGWDQPYGIAKHDEMRLPV